MARGRAARRRCGRFEGRRLDWPGLRNEGRSSPSEQGHGDGPNVDGRRLYSTPPGDIQALLQQFKNHVESHAHESPLVFSAADFDAFRKEHDYVKALFLSGAAKVIIDEEEAQDHVEGGEGPEPPFMSAFMQAVDDRHKTGGLPKVFRALLEFADPEASSILSIANVAHHARLILLAMCAACAAFYAVDFEPIATLFVLGIVGTGMGAMLVRNFVDGSVTHASLPGALGQSSAAACTTNPGISTFGSDISHLASRMGFIPLAVATSLAPPPDCGPQP